MSAHKWTVDDLSRLAPVGTGGPTSIEFTDAGQALLYLMADAEDTVHSLWHHPVGQAPRCILAGGRGEYDLAEELARERQRLVRDGVTSFQTGGGVIAVRAGGALLRGAVDGVFAPWPGADGAEAERLAPDGTFVLAVRDGDVWQVDAAGATRRLTHDAEDGVTNGLPDYAAAEELDRQDGMWLSLDGRYLAFARVDARAVEPYTITHAADPAPWIETVRYPFAGGPNASVRLGVLDLGAREPAPVWLFDSAADDSYLVRVVWTRGGDLLTLVYSRDQHRAEWRRHRGGRGPAETFGRQAGASWLPLPAGIRLAPDDALITTREVDGHSHLVRYEHGGEERILTGGDWDVTAIYAAPADGSVWFQRTDRLGLDRRVARLRPDGRMSDVTPEPGVHGAVVSDDGARFVRQTQSRLHPTATTVCDVAGETVFPIYAPPADAQDLGLAPPEIVDLAAEDGTVLHGAVYRPADGTDGGRRPAVVSVYGGPHAQRVREEWALTADLRCQYLAQQGFVVFKLDNRGSEGRGMSFARAVEHAFGTVEVADQVTGARWLAAHENVDPGRIGIFGWSYGGFMTLQCLMQAPEVFRSGVAGAPVTDFARYDTAYTERHLGTPASNPEAYRQANVLERADGLQGNLLLIHGLIDENVHFAHTARLVQTLIAAGKAFDLAVLPQSRHLPRDPATRRYVEARTLGWLVSTLGETQA